MSIIQINDVRQTKDFKGITFSKYKKSEAKKELLKTLLAGNIEQSCYWSAEFICSGDFLYLWDIIFYFMSKHIHIGNPKLPIYISSRLELFKNIINNGYSNNIIKLRNNENIRKIFIEIIGILCCSKKKNSYDVPKIDESSFNMLNLTDKLIAKNKMFGERVFRHEDPKEIFIAVNEFAWNIKNKDMFKVIYWLEWIIEYEKLCKKRKIIKKCAKRNMPVHDKFQRDIIWIIWDVILNNIEGEGLRKNINALLTIFCLKYKDSYKTKRKLLIYYAISLLTEEYDVNTPIVKNSRIIHNIKKNCDQIYKQIKKNEISPKDNYLFNGLNEKNLEKTINKLDKMTSLTYIPRS